MINLQQLGFGARRVPATGSGSCGVLFLGEAPGEQEDEMGEPFYRGAPSGSVLERAIRRVGMNREQFVIDNTVPFRPPNNYLEGAPYEVEATTVGLELLSETIERFKPRAIVALGSVATRAVTGLTGPKLGIGNLAGFILPSRFNIPVIPTFHPAYLRRGKMSHLGVVIRAIKIACRIAREGHTIVRPPVDAPPRGYIMYPTEEDAHNFMCGAKSGNWPYLAYDIETMYSNNEEEAEEHDDQDLRSIQFSLSANSGIFMPWRPPFIAVATQLLSLTIPKLSWNGWRFDRPALRRAGLEIAGTEHDLMWAWHHLQPDLPRGLQFACAQLGWPWPWKHLDHASPSFYGIVDVDALHWMLANP